MLVAIFPGPNIKKPVMGRRTEYFAGSGLLNPGDYRNGQGPNSVKGDRRLYTWKGEVCQ